MVMVLWFVNQVFLGTVFFIFTLYFFSSVDKKQEQLCAPAEDTVHGLPSHGAPFSCL